MNKDAIEKMKKIVQAEILRYFQAGDLPDWLRITKEHHRLSDIPDNRQIKEPIKLIFIILC